MLEKMNGGGMVKYAQLVLDAEMSVAFRAPVGSRCQDFGSGFDVQSATVAAFENLLKQ